MLPLFTIAFLMPPLLAITLPWLRYVDYYFACHAALR